MASDPERAAAEETVVLDSDDDADTGELAQTDEEWPLSDLYRVESSDPGSVDPAEEAPALPMPPQVEKARGRFPHEVGARAVLAFAATAGVALLAVALLGTRGGDEPAADAANSAGVPAQTQPSTTSTATTPVDDQPKLPSLVGLNLTEVRSAIADLGLRARVVRIASDAPRDQVIRHTPAAGASIDKASVVVLTVSSGAPFAPEPAPAVDVPDVVGAAASEATATIRDAGLEARIRLVDSSRDAGTVIRQSPAANTEVAKGATVRLDVARHRPTPPTVQVPDVVGLDAAEARSRLVSLGLTVTLERVRSDEAAGTVIDQSPRAGAERQKGTRTTLTVSTGPAQVDVPDVTGLDERSARLELENAGFQVHVSETPATDPEQDGVVVGQTPKAGARAEEGTLVTLVVARLG